MNLALLKRKLKQTSVTAHDQHDLLALAQLSHAALAAAIHLWEENAPADMKGMLTGEQGWRWDSKIQKYRSMSGRIVGDYELKQLAEEIAAALKKKNRHILLLFLAGGIPMLMWRHRTATELVAFYLLMGMLGSGGVDHLKPPVKKIIVGAPGRPPGLMFTLERLRTFTRKLEEEGIKPTPGIQARLDMYTDSAHTIFEESRRVSHQDEAKRVGKRLEERNILGDADHCATTNGVIGCPEWTKRGWLPAGTIAPIGMRPCLTNCRCKMGFRMVDA